MTLQRRVKIAAMKKHHIPALSAAVALLFAFAAILPLGSAFAVQPAYNAPQGYNSNDFNKVVAFLELRDENNVRNGEKCSPNYNPNDPTSWGREGNYDDPENIVEPTTFTWTETQGEKRITEITCYNNDLVGSLDLSNCSSLMSLNCARNRLSGINVSQCTSLGALICSANGLTSLNLSTNSNLTSLTCDNNALTSINLSGNPNLRSLTIGGNSLSSLSLSSNPNLLFLSCKGCNLSSLNVSSLTMLLGLYCADNRLSQLNVSSNTRLQYLDCSGNNLNQLNLSANATIVGVNCSGNNLASLDLSQNRLLSYFNCLDNRFTSLDLSATRLGFDAVRAQSGGTVGCTGSVTGLGNEEMPALTNTVVAQPNSGYHFTGWYNEAGALISSSARYDLPDSTERVFIAHFAEGSEPDYLLGDVNGDGSITASDAVLVLRYSLNLIGLSPEQLERADMNGDGNVNATDALVILRTAMHIV